MGRLRRAIQRDLSEAVDQWGWKARFPLFLSAIEALQILDKEADMFNGHGIKSLATAIPVKTLLHGARTKPGAVYYPTQSKAAAVVAGDASDKAVCAYTVSGPDLYMREPLPPESRACRAGTGNFSLTHFSANGR